MSTLQGALEKEQLFSLLSYLKLTSASGRLEVIFGQEYGDIYVDSGEVMHAEAGVLQGQPAMKKMSNWAGGRFKFHPGERSPKSSIDTSLEGLALSIAVDADEKREDTGGQSVDLDRRVRFSGKIEGEVTLSADELSLLPRLTGSASLRQIGQALNWGETRLRQAVALLDARGLLQISVHAPNTVSKAFMQDLRQVYTSLLGPAAEFLLSDVCRTLDVEFNAVPNTRFSELMRTIADSIDDTPTRDRFVQSLVQLRGKHGI
jgi:Domain of unknown function (DUF4388)